MYSSSQLLSTNIWPFKDISLKCDCFNGRPAVELLLLHLVDLLYMVLLFELVQLLGHLEGLLDLGGWSATAGIGDTRVGAMGPAIFVLTKHEEN